MDARVTGWWETRWFAAFAILFACVPLLWPPFPPLTDALEHAGRYRSILDGGTGPLAQWYTIHWRPVGNLGADVLAAALGPLIGLEPAVKAIAILIVALTAAGCLAVSRAAHGRVSPFALFALPLVYNQGFNLGFLNYTLAMALMLLAFALWLRMAGNRWRSAVFVPAAVLIWGAHVFGWAVLGLVAFAAEWTARRNPVRAALACWPLAAPLPLMLLWRSGDGAVGGFLNLKAKLLAVLMSFRDTWFAVDVLTLAAVLCVIVYGIRRAGSARPVANAALAFLAAFLALPSLLMGSSLADSRAAPYVLIVALLALRPINARQARAAAIAGLVFFLARIAVATVSTTLASQAQTHEALALDHIPVGSRVVQFVSLNCADGWALSRIEHIGGLAQVRRRAFVNSQWPDIGATIVVTHYPAARPFENDPTHIVPCDDGATLRRRLAAVPRGAFDRLWLVDIPEGVPDRLPGMTRLWSDRDSAVYRIDR